MTQDIRHDHSSDTSNSSVGTGTTYRAAARGAIVAGVFTAMVCGLLWFDFNQRPVDELTDAPQFVELKAQLAQEPQNEEIKEQLRRLDLQLREDYFRHRRFTAAGAWLLLCGVVVLVAATKWAVVTGQKLPKPELQAGPRDAETQRMRIARWSVVGLGALFAAGMIVWHAASDTLLPRTPDELAALVNSDSSGRSGSGTKTGIETGMSGTPIPPQVPGFPTDEENRANWPRFRGSDGSGVSSHQNVPTAWDATAGDGILWKTPVPQPGKNSPVLWGDRVFLAGATDEVREVYAFDADSGELLWQGDVPAGPQVAIEPPDPMDDTGFAAPTVTTDGRRVYAIFATGDAAAFDFDGNRIWTRSLGVPENTYGHSASLAMFENLVLIQFDQGGPKDELSKMIALDGLTGKTAWQVTRDVANSWPTPIVVQTADGSKQLITCSDPWVIAYRPADGSEIWRAKRMQGDVGPSPVFANGVVYTVPNDYGYLSAIRIDGTGDVTKSHLLWEGEDGLSDMCSPLVTDEYVFLIYFDMLTCYDVTNGEVLWDETFDDSFTSSPSLAGDYVYLFGEEGLCWVLKPGRESCERIAQCNLGEPCVTSPAFRDGRLYIRGEEHLFCIGNE